ncbi:MAG: hypothetical protein NTV84_05570 [Methanoregula sp.]|nr:hypothetical protein [Methanoregula sp.]
MTALFPGTGYGQAIPAEAIADVALMLEKWISLCMIVPSRVLPV